MFAQLRQNLFKYKQGILHIVFYIFSTFVFIQGVSVSVFLIN